MKFADIPQTTQDHAFVFIECDITGKTKKTRYGAARANVERNGGKYITNWGLAKLNNPMKNAAVREKVRQTNLERYGETLPMNSAEQIVKRQEQFKDKAFVAARTKKIKQTNIEKYGADHIMRTEDGRAKVCATMVERHGVPHPYQSSQIMANMKANNLQKHGVENVAMLSGVQDKMQATREAKYGVSHYNQLPQMREYLRSNCKEWLAESYANPWAKGITRPQDWNDKQRESMKELIATGTWKGGGWKSAIKGRVIVGKCKKQPSMFRSSLELRVHIWLMRNDNVDWYDYEPFAIDYHDGEVQRFYCPDFLVRFKDADKLRLIEVKPNYLHEVEATKAKTAAAQKYVKDHQIEYVLWGQDHIKSLLTEKTQALLELPNVERL